MDNCSKELAVLVENDLFEKLSSLQQKIVLELAFGPLTLSELSKKTGSSVHTIGKQLSLLQFRTKYNSLRSKGFEKPLVKKNKEAGIRTTYLLNIGELLLK